MLLFGKPDPSKLLERKDLQGLLKALAHKDSVVRWRAAEALGALGDSRAVEPLIAALKDQGSTVRSEAAKALGALKDPRAFQPLVAALDGASELEQPSFVESLCSFGEAAAPMLVRFVKHPYLTVQSSVQEALVALGPLAVPHLLDGLASGDQDLRAEIVPARFRNNAGIVGAALLAAGSASR